MAYISIYVIFSQGQNERHGEQISGCQDLGKVEGGEWKWP